MRVIIAGSRTATRADVANALEHCPFFKEIDVVISGTARGADSYGAAWAREERIPVEEYPADWNKYGKRAGYLRNEEMVEKADALVAVWNGWSKGTRHVIDIAKDKGIPVYIHYFTEKEKG